MKPASVRAFYYWSTLVPFVVPLLAGAVLLDGRNAGPDAAARPVFEAAFLVAVTGAWSAGPYLLFLAVVRLLGPPRNDAGLRRLAWAAPLLIGAGVGLARAAVAGLQGEGYVAARSAFAFWSISALAVGYPYVALISTGLAIAKRLGWVKSSP